MMINCPCDEKIFPPVKTIPAGLGDIPRQLATFPEFRAAMLAAIGGEAALHDWRARAQGDFGIMLLEMWAYVCDNVTFYDQVLGNEFFVRPATQRSSLRKLMGLLGYQPRPAVGATVQLAVLAEGRKSVTMPVGTQFRSGAFPGGTPQVFEMDVAAKVHPLLNKWALLRRRPPTLGGLIGAPTSFESLLLNPKTIAIKAEQFLLLEIAGDAASTAVRAVTEVAEFSPSDAEKLKRVTWSGAVTWPGTTAMPAIHLSTPSQTATLWKIPDAIPLLIEADLSGTLKIIKVIGAKVYPQYYGIHGLPAGTQLFFDSLYREIRSGSRLILEKEGELRWFRVTDLGETTMQLPGGTATSPAPKVPVTWVELDTGLNDPARKPPGASNWSGSDVASIVVHYGMRTAGVPLQPYVRVLSRGDPLNLTPPLEAPIDGSSTNDFLLADKDGTGAELTGNIDFNQVQILPDQTSGLTAPLLAPVTAYGNVVSASRGETVAIEVLGDGDATLANQSFTLKKKPLTYLPAPTADNEQGVNSTLGVYVDGVLWKEAPSLYNLKPDAQVYMIRHDDQQNATLTFASPLPTGASNVVAMYRFGAEKISPPAGSITQLGKPVKGVQSVKNPVPASGGDDQEPASQIRKYGPSSALLLGRAISVQDMEAAASTGGARAVKAEWIWNDTQQRAVVQIWYIGAQGLAAKISQKLRNLTDPATPIAVSQAQAVPSSLSVAISIDPRYLENNVVNAVRAALMNPETGMLAPELIGIGAALFRSRIFDVVLNVPGAAAVEGLLWNSALFTDWGIEPGSGKYFDLETGSLVLNGKAGPV
jgi:hypothetical protein